MARKLTLAALLAAALSACSSGSSSNSKALPNHPTGPVSSVPAVSASKTVLDATTDTHEVETDGKWIVWKGRQINLSYFDGSKITALDLGLHGSVSPWAFDRNCERSPVAFDGTTLAFVARDVSKAEGPALYVARPGQDARRIDLPFRGTDSLDYVRVHVSGTVAAVWDTDLGELRALDISASAPTWSDNLLPESGDVYQPGGALLPVAVTGHLELLELPSGTPVVLTGDDNAGTTPHSVRYSAGIFTWVEGSRAYYFDPATATDSAAIAAGAADQFSPVAGPGYFVWNEEGQVLYKTTAGEAQVTGLARDLAEVGAGNGFLAYIAYDGESADQIYAYDLSDLTATEGVQVSQNGADAEEPNAGYSAQVDGDRIYAVFAYEDRHIPGKSLVTYDFATSTLSELIAPAETQRIPVVRAAGGKAIVLHADQAFRLFAKSAGSGGAPSVVTPPQMNVKGFNVSGGLVAFAALDRAAWAPEMLDDVIRGEDAIEIYSLALDGDRTVRRITSNVTEDDAPETDGRWITWRDDENDYGFAYDTKEEVTKLVGETSYRVKVSGGVAVWRQSSGIYMYNLTTDEAKQLYQGTSIQKCPDVAGNLVTWADDAQVMYFDLSDTSGEAQAVEGSNAVASYRYGESVYTEAAPVATDGRYLVWQDTRQGWTPEGATDPVDAHVVVIHDTTSATTVDLSPGDWTQTGWEVEGEDDGHEGPLCNPRISNGVVAFNSIEYGEDNPDADKELFYAKLGDLATAAPAVVRLTSDPDDDPETTEVDESAALWDSRSKISNGLIVWRTGGTEQAAFWYGKSPAAARVE